MITEDELAKSIFGIYQQTPVAIKYPIEHLPVLISYRQFGDNDYIDMFYSKVTIVIHNITVYVFASVGTEKKKICSFYYTEDGFLQYANHPGGLTLGNGLAFEEYDSYGNVIYMIVRDTTGRLHNLDVSKAVNMADMLH
jgi:hypothetical protein